MYSKAYKYALAFLVLGLASATNFCNFPNDQTLEKVKFGGMPTQLLVTD